MDNPILEFVFHNTHSPISAVRAELEDRRWIVSIAFAGLQRESASQAEPGVMMTVLRKPADARCRLPAATSPEVVETWMREVAEVGDSRDYARTPDGCYFLTKPARWGCDYRKATVARNRTAYLFGDTYRLRGALKAAGLRWATKRKAWYGPLHICREVAAVTDLTLYIKPPTCKTIRV